MPEDPDSPVPVWELGGHYQGYAIQQALKAEGIASFFEGENLITVARGRILVRRADAERAVAIIKAGDWPTNPVRRLFR